MPTVLHVGCGTNPAPTWLSDYQEVRLDIDPRVEPDVIASMTDLGAIGPFDLIYTCHALEHLYPHDVRVALAEFLRVLKPGGGVVIVVPNLDGVKPDEEVLYESDAGPVCGLDMYYGMARLIAENPHMAHHSGFVPATLEAAMQAAGFMQPITKAIGGWSVVGMGVKA